MRKAIISALIVVGGLLAYDFIFAEASSRLRGGNPCRSGAHVCAEVRLSGVKYDVQSHSLRGTFGMSLKSTDDKDICTVAFSSFDNGNGREWITGKTGFQKTCPKPQQSGECLLQAGEEALSSGNTVTSASFDCKETILSESSGAEEIWYPFDKYEAALAPKACVNTQDDACGIASKAEDAAIGEISIAVADQNLTGTIGSQESRLGSYKLIVKRRLFVRLVSVIFLLLSLAFLQYLVSQGDPKDLLPKSLGFFATLWGLRTLIVPSSINIFPTIVDYAILTIFCLLFLLVFLKLHEQKTKAEVDFV